MIKIYDRRLETIVEEKVLGGKLLHLLYEKPYGKPFLFFVKRKFFSSFYGKLMDTSWSKRMIPKFIQNHGLSTEEILFPLNAFSSFNDFFIRRLKTAARPVSENPDTFISPCDARLLAYEHLSIDAVIQVKGLHYPLQDLLGQEALAEEFQGGTVLIFRLNPLDYHRFHFFDEGIPGKSKAISGSYYSVNPVALKKIPRLYIENKRVLTPFHSKHFGKALYVEVGATNVGTIVETYAPEVPVKRGQEKGYFKFGGSTVILFLQKNQVHLDQDILKNSIEGIETRVLFGESIGQAYKGS
ncbi:MAG TPA: phosphatidylserine decarboxylase [Clostridiaceae bacterium]|nr:phosphatidylserine decarboxylase [Clostridiaceae bacterium]